MNFAAIRSDLATVLTGLGFTAWDYVPGDPVTLPAGIVNPPSETNYSSTMKGSTAVLAVTLYASLASFEDAQRRLDAALSTGVTGSLVDAVRAASASSWRAARVIGAGAARSVVIGEATALAIDLNLELTT